MHSGRPLILLLVVQSFVWAPAQNTRRYVPPPLKVQVPFEAAWDTMLETLELKEFTINHQDRARGILLTEFVEYISGPLTGGHLSKIGEKPKLIDGDWVRVRYQYEIMVELLRERDTWVSVYANIQALKRDFGGKEAWTEIQTNGNLEARLLVDFGRSLFGQSFNLEIPKEGFWKREPRDPGQRPGSENRTPRSVGPELRP